MKQFPVNIKMKFGKAIVILATHTDRATTTEGVVLYVKMTPSTTRAWADIPEGTLKKYMHLKPVIVSCDWIKSDAQSSREARLLK